MDVIIYGAGGHSSVVIDALLNSIKDISIKCLVDDDKDKWGKIINGFPVVSPEGLEKYVEEAFFFLAIGENELRRKKAEELGKLGVKFLTVVHPTASVASTAIIEEGTLVCAQAVVNPYAKVGKHCIINSGAIVEHHCVIRDFVHIAPNATLGGGVYIGEGTLIGLSSTVLLRKRIGENCVVGAGAVVIDDIPPNTTVVGVPAKPIRKGANK